MKKILVFILVFFCIGSMQKQMEITECLFFKSHDIHHYILYIPEYKEFRVIKLDKLLLSKKAKKIFKKFDILYVEFLYKINDYYVVNLYKEKVFFNKMLVKKKLAIFDFGEFNG